MAGDVISVTTQVEDTSHKEVGMIRYHYDPSIGFYNSILIVGVGTAMSVSSYDKLSQQIAVGSSTVVIIIDHSVGSMVKTSPENYARLANEIYSQLNKLIPIYSESTPEIILLGGHSSSGQASMKAIQLDLVEFQFAGYVGLDPFDMSDNFFDDFVLQQPAIYWGFTKTTCLVSKDHAAAEAYEFTSDKARVLYVINNEDTKITHCVFTDQGCGFRPFTCSTQADFDWVFKDVADSVDLFIDVVAAENVPFDKEHFILHENEDISLYVNDDEVELLKSVERYNPECSFASWKKYIGWE